MTPYEITLLAVLAYREARGESQDAQLGVIWTVKNRVASPVRWWGKTIAQVILCPSQYSSFNREDPNSTLWPTEGDPVWKLLDLIVAHNIPDNTGGATHYYSGDEAPYWADDLTPTIKIGGLQFMK